MLGDHLGASRDLTLDTVSRIEVAMQRLETNMNQEFKMMGMHLAGCQLK